MTTQPGNHSGPADRPGYGLDLGHGLLRLARLEPGGAFAERPKDTPEDPGRPGRAGQDPSGLRALLAPVLRGAAGRLAAAVPQSWLAPGADGRAPGPEAARLRALLGTSGNPAVELVPGPVAALAVPEVRAALPDGTSRVVVADLGVSHAELVLCGLSPVPHPLAWVSTGAPDAEAYDAHHALARLALPGGSDADRLALARDLFKEMRQGEAEASDEVLLKARLDRTERAQRAAAGEPEDETAPDWQAVPVYGRSRRDVALALAAGPVLDLLDGLAVPLEALAVRLRETTGVPAAGTALVFLGGGAAFEPLREAVARGLGRDGSPPWNGRTAVHAAARGAALVASGKAVLGAPREWTARTERRAQTHPEPPKESAGGDGAGPRPRALPQALALGVHREIGADTSEWLAPLPLAGAAVYVRDPVTGGDAAIEWAGPQALRLWSRPDQEAEFEPVEVDPARVTVPPGTYRVGLRLDPTGPVLLFAPPDGSPPLSVPLSAAAPAAFAEGGPR